MLRTVPLLLLSASLVVAHHSIDQDYDRFQQVDHKVTVTRLDFKNPHVLLYATQAKEGANWGRLIRITMPDGKTFEDESSSAMPAGTSLATKAPADGHKK